MAPPALSRNGLLPQTLADAIDQASTPAMRAAAAALGQRIRDEDGIRRAVDQLEAWALLEAGAPVSVDARSTQPAMA